MTELQVSRDKSSSDSRSTFSQDLRASRLATPRTPRDLVAASQVRASISPGNASSMISPRDQDIFEADDELEDGRHHSACFIEEEDFDEEDFLLSDAYLRLKDAEEEEADIPNEELTEDTFGMTICAMVRDFYFMASGKGTLKARLARISTSITLLLVCVSTQVFLLGEVQTFVSAKTVHDIRLVYGEFEHHMYGNHVTLTVNGKYRGIPGFFNKTAFETLPEGLKAEVCRIPLSQPHFFFVILFIWSITCASDLKICLWQFQSLIRRTGHASSMSEALVHVEGEVGSLMVIQNLTIQMKFSLVVMVFGPRLFITLYLLWLGCRWLLSTDDFSDLIFNACALEFILALKDVMFVALVPARNKRDLAHTHILSPVRKEVASLWAFVNTSLWGIASFLWVLLYIYKLQMVLPEYKWDVHEVCRPWIQDRYSV